MCLLYFYKYTFWESFGASSYNEDENGPDKGIRQMIIRQMIYENERNLRKYTFFLLFYLSFEDSYDDP